MTSPLAAFVETGPKDAPQATAHQLFEAARREWLASRAIFGDQNDFRFDSYIARRAGLTEAQEKALGQEALAYFRERREASEKAVIREREASLQREIEGRLAASNEGARIDWLAKHLASFFCVADDLRAVAAEIEAAKGKRPTSIYLSAEPPIQDDSAIVALTSRLADRLTAALAVITLTGRDAQARMRMEQSK